MFISENALFGKKMNKSVFFCFFFHVTEKMTISLNRFQNKAFLFANYNEKLFNFFEN